MKIFYTARCHGLLSVLAVFLTTGCVHNFHYEPAKQRSYAPASIASKSDTGIFENTSPARYTSSARIEKERYRDPNILGNLHVKNEMINDDESLVFAIRKEHRAYKAETPIGPAIQAGKHKITPNFSVGLHKDHKAIAGFVFRMPF